MDQKEIDALEPKFTGNQRDLTEGEAQAIVHDPANQIDSDDDLTADVPAAAAAYGLFRRT
ncbi:hypothetical protein [Paenibacillus hexagrammi]|uniref:Uncharacterized protein n=1 Tax=Paenibacillus hexagrammi TaxID=2908839 RepID=A0ABY3SE74_9BACL|nr:hypothetical protein [Paenibacillus sp. YPD9-1]UJF31524.1 hypothetical protein L0M14_17095 [Paenibacillus sp. YPD9-1]